MVHYGDSDVLLDVITLRRRVKTKKYSQTITNYKKQRKGPEGGYLVSNGRGLGISFAIHHAQPYCSKLSIRVPDRSSPALLAAQDAANRDEDASRASQHTYYHALSFTLILSLKNTERSASAPPCELGSAHPLPCHLRFHVYAVQD